MNQIKTFVTRSEGDTDLHILFYRDGDAGHVTLEIEESGEWWINLPDGDAVQIEPRPAALWERLKEWGYIQ